MRGSFTEWRRDAREWLRAHRSELWILTAIWVLISLVIFWLAKGHVSPRRAQDEFLFWGVAKSFAEGNGLTWRGQGIGLYSALYPILLAPAFWIAEDVQGRYTIVHLLNAMMMSAAIFPGFFLARMMMDRWRALIVALMVVSVPAMNYAGLIATETLGYPVFVAACGAMVLALARPRARNTLFAFALIFVAMFTRAQFAVLLPVFFGTVFVAGWLRPSGQGTQYVMERKSIWISVLAMLAAAGVYLFLRGPSALGLYAGFLSDVPFEFGKAWYWIKSFTADVYLLSVIIPGIATLAMLARSENRRDPVIGALLAVALVASLALIVQVSWFSATSEFDWRAQHIFYERYMFYLGPLYFAGFLAAIGRVSWKAALASTLMATVIVSGFQTDAVLIPVSYDSFGLSLVGFYMKYHPASAPHIGMLLASVTLVLGLAYTASVLPGRIARTGGWVLVALVLALLVYTQGVAWNSTRKSSESNFALFPRPADLIAKNTDQPVGMIVTSDTSQALLFTAEFWNPNLVRFFATEAVPIRSPELYSPHCELGVTEQGRITSPDCDFIPNAWFMRGRRLVIHLQDEYKRVHPAGIWNKTDTLMVARAPARILSLVKGRYVRNGLVDSRLFVGVYSDGPGEIRVKFRGAGEPAEIRGLERSWRLGPQGRLTLREGFKAPGGFFMFGVKSPSGSPGKAIVTEVEMRKGDGPWRSLL